MKLQMQSPKLDEAVAAREASMYKKPRERPAAEAGQDNLTTIQKLAWNAHDKIFGMAADIGAQKPKNAVPATEEAFFSKAQQREALADIDKIKQGSSKNARDADRARMMADIKAKAKKGAKKAPSFEIMDVTETEREKGEKIAAYQARKAEEQR